MRSSPSQVQSSQKPAARYGGYLRYEVTYASSTAPGRHVWGWADVRKEVDRMLQVIALNSNLSAPDVLDRAVARKPAIVAPVARSRPGLLL